MLSTLSRFFEWWKWYRLEHQKCSLETVAKLRAIGGQRAVTVLSRFVSTNYRSTYAVDALAEIGDDPAFETLRKVHAGGSVTCGPEAGVVVDSLLRLANRLRNSQFLKYALDARQSFECEWALKLSKVEEQIAALVKPPEPEFKTLLILDAYKSDALRTPRICAACGRDLQFDQEKRTAKVTAAYYGSGMSGRYQLLLPLCPVTVCANPSKDDFAASATLSTMEVPGVHSLFVSTFDKLNLMRGNEFGDIITSWIDNSRLEDAEKRLRAGDIVMARYELRQLIWKEHVTLYRYDNVLRTKAKKLIETTNAIVDGWCK